MAELNVSLILRLVDRISGPARAASAAVNSFSRVQASVAKVSQAAGKATSAGSAANLALASSAKASATATAGLQRVTTVATTATANFGSAVNAAAGASRAAGQSADALARSEDNAGRAAEASARRFSLLERAQMRGRAAMRMLGTEIDKIDKQLGRLAMASLAVEGVAPAAHALSHLVGHSVREAAGFSSGMTGFGITAEMTDRQMAPIRSAILQASRRYALDPEAALETFAFTRRSGVFTKPAAIVAAGDQAARFQKLADRMGSPVTGEEAAGGASSAVREYGFAASRAGLERYFAMINAAEKVGGGMKLDDLLQYSRSAGGQMKAFGMGNAAGLADVLAGMQVSNMLAHTGAQAGINYQDMLAYITNRHSVLRFKREGVDLPSVIQGAWERGQGPNVAFVRLLEFMTRGLPGPKMKFKLGSLLGNQQAAQAAMANIQNLPTVMAWARRIARPAAVADYRGDIARATSGPAAAIERLAVDRKLLAIAIGDNLLPLAGRLAGVLDRITGAATRIVKAGGPVGRFVAISLAGFAGLLAGSVALGHALVAVAAPLVTLRFLTGKALPLSLTALRGAVANATGGVLNAVRAMTIGIIADPAAWPIVAGIALLAGAALLVRKYWQPITTWLGGAWSGLAEGLRPLAPVVGQIGLAFAPIGRFLGAAWGWFMRLIAPVQLTGEQLKRTADSGRQFGLALAGLIRGAIGLPGQLFQIGRQLVQGLINGVISMGAAASRAIGGMADQVVTWFKGRLGIHSPSTVFAELGQFTMQGFLQGVNRTAPAIEARFRAMAVAALAAAHSGLAGAGSGVGRLAGSLSQRAVQAAAYFRSRGWTAAQSAGIVANLVRESGLNPGAVNAASGAYGVTQWLGGRVRGFEQFTGRALRGSSMLDQLGFTDHELRSSYGRVGQALRVASSAGQAAALINDRFEINGVRGEGGRRAAVAEHIAAMIAAGASTAAATPADRSPGSMPAREIHHHHSCRMTFQIAGKHDPRAIAREIDHLQGRARDAALHDGADDF